MTTSERIKLSQAVEEKDGAGTIGVIIAVCVFCAFLVMFFVAKSWYDRRALLTAKEKALAYKTGDDPGENQPQDVFPTKLNSFREKASTKNLDKQTKDGDDSGFSNISAGNNKESIEVMMDGKQGLKTGDIELAIPDTPTKNLQALVGNMDHGSGSPNKSIDLMDSEEDNSNVDDVPTKQKMPSTRVNAMNKSPGSTE